MFWLWLIVAVVLFAVGSYCIGRFDIGDGEAAGPLWTCLLGSLLWPGVLGVVVIAGPSIGLFWLGERKRKKKQASDSN